MDVNRATGTGNRVPGMSAGHPVRVSRGSLWQPVVMLGGGDRRGEGWRGMNSGEGEVGLCDERGLTGARIARGRATGELKICGGGVKMARNSFIHPEEDLPEDALP